MSTKWIAGLVLLAGVGMWLAVGRPSNPGLEPSDTSDEADAQARAAQPMAAKLYAPHRPDAAVQSDEPAYDEPAAAPAPKPKGPPSDFLPGERGPVEQYEALYQRSTRDSVAHEIEDTIKTAFGRSSTPDLLHSTSCREQICKVLIRWTPERTRDYVAAMRGLALGMAWPPGQPGFESQIAITTASQTDKDGGRLVELLIKRRSPDAPKPTFAGGEKHR